MVVRVGMVKIVGWRISGLCVFGGLAGLIHWLGKQIGGIWCVGVGGGWLGREMQ